jgi:hypothetical protein
MKRGPPPTNAANSMRYRFAALAHVARREAPDVSGNGRGTIGLRFSARDPPHSRGKRSWPGRKPASRQRTRSPARRGEMNDYRKEDTSIVERDSVANYAFDV